MTALVKEAPCHQISVVPSFVQAFTVSLVLLTIKHLFFFFFLTFSCPNLSTLRWIRRPPPPPNQIPSIPHHTQNMNMHMRKDLIVNQHFPISGIQNPFPNRKKRACTRHFRTEPKSFPLWDFFSFLVIFLYGLEDTSRSVAFPVQRRHRNKSKMISASFAIASCGDSNQHRENFFQRMTTLSHSENEGALTLETREVPLQ